MIIKPAKRTESVQEYYFSRKNREMDALNAARAEKGLPKIKGNVEGVTKGRYIIDEYKKQLDEIPDEFWGFTQKEVEKMLDYYNLSDKMGALKYWYEGYSYHR